MEKALEFLKKAGTFYLATVDENGQPRVRPFGAVCAIDGRLCLITSNQKDVYKQIMKNPKVEISGMVGGEWIRLAAEAYEDVRRESRVAMLEANPALKGMYSPDDGKIAVLYLKNATATFCSFTAAPETVTF